MIHANLCQRVRAFSDLARNGNELVWTMTTLVAGLNVFLASEAAVLVLSTAFSVRCDPQCVLPRSGTWSYPSKTYERYGFRLACATHPRAEIPSQVRLVFEKGSVKVLQRSRYVLDCTIGRRLAEDYALMSHLANICGLQEEINRSVSCDTFAEQLKVNLTLILIALTSQALPWKARLARMTSERWYPSMEREHCIFFYKGSVYLDSYSNPVLFHFLYAIQSAGLPISIHTVEHMEPFGHDLNFLRPSDRQAWYESKEYSRVLKTESWWPSRLAYADWQEARRGGQRSLSYRLFRGQRGPHHRQVAPSVDILLDPYVQQLKREYGVLMTPHAAFAGLSAETPRTDIGYPLDWDIYNWHNNKILPSSELGGGYKEQKSEMSASIHLVCDPSLPTLEMSGGEELPEASSSSTSRPPMSRIPLER